MSNVFKNLLKPKYKIVVNQSIVSHCGHLYLLSETGKLYKGYTSDYGPYIVWERVNQPEESE